MVKKLNLLHNHTIFCRVALLGSKKALNNAQWGVNNVLWSPLKIILFLWWVSYRRTFPYFKIMGLNWRCSSFVVFIMVIGTNVGVVLPWLFISPQGKLLFESTKSPFSLRETWLGLLFCFFPKENLFFPRAFSLKKLLKGFFFSSISFMEGEKNLKEISNCKPLGWNKRF